MHRSGLILENLDRLDSVLYPLLTRAERTLVAPTHRMLSRVGGQSPTLRLQGVVA